MANYSRQDYAKLRYNAYSLKKGDKLDFDDIELYKSFHLKIAGIDNALIFKWVCFMYDLKSPLINIADIKKRSIIAASEAGFPRDSKRRFIKGYGNVVIFDESIMHWLGKRIHEYCRMQNDADFTQLMVFELVRVRNNNDLIDPSTEIEDSKKLIDAQSKLKVEIDILRTKYLNGDDSDVTYKEIMNAIENENMEYSVDQIALNEKVREEIAKSSPYGRWAGRQDKYSLEDLNEEERETLEKELKNDTDECREHFEALGIDHKDYLNREIRNNKQERQES
jgi:hypothetical protein